MEEITSCTVRIGTDRILVRHDDEMNLNTVTLYDENDKDIIQTVAVGSMQEVRKNAISYIVTALQASLNRKSIHMDHASALERITQFVIQKFQDIIADMPLDQALKYLEEL